MRAVFLMFDSLNRHWLDPYGGNAYVPTPNFGRLAEKSVTFDQCFVGSMPCMPARRELHTGRYNFLHRSWGPLEPFDFSMPRALKENGVHSHLTTDHYHYFEDGGCTYHTKFSTWEFFRGQEGDPWKGQVRKVEIGDRVASRGGPMWEQDFVNRQFIEKEEDFPQYQTVSNGLEYIERNKDDPNWYVQIETFDPHEPFYAPEKYRKLAKADEIKTRPFDWPLYRQVEETPDEVERCRREYAALLAFCDAQLGRVLDKFDAENLWEDTMLIVGTDHGFLLGEHDWWAKMQVPFYNEKANTPLFIWDPREKKAGTRAKSLCQTMDLVPTLLNYFGVEYPETVQGVDLAPAVAEDAIVREAGLLGLFGRQINLVTNDNVYMRAPRETDEVTLHQYTLMPTNMRAPFPVSSLQGMELAEGFSFLEGAQVLKIPSAGRNMPGSEDLRKDWLWDLKEDPKQEKPVQNAELEAAMCRKLVEEMRKAEAPEGLYDRFALREYC